MKTAFLDVDSQLDFLYPAGALYVPGAERVAPAIARLNRHAAEIGAPLISTVDAHDEDDPEFRSWPPHCIRGTLGQRKAEGTLLAGHITVPFDGPVPALADARQIVVEKKSVDVFAGPNLGRVLAALDAGRVAVYGVVTEICVLYAARGLARLGKSVVVVADAIRELNADDARHALDEIRAAGGSIASLAEILTL